MLRWYFTDTAILQHMTAKLDEVFQKMLILIYAFFRNNLCAVLLATKDCYFASSARRSLEGLAKYSYISWQCFYDFWSGTIHVRAFMRPMRYSEQWHQFSNPAWPISSTISFVLMNKKLRITACPIKNRCAVTTLREWLQENFQFWT